MHLLFSRIGCGIGINGLSRSWIFPYDLIINENSNVPLQLCFELVD